MNLVKNKIECCGCGACVASCPTNAIELVPDEYGFLYPKIDDNKCIGCKKCERVCAYKNSNLKINEQKIFAVSNKNNLELKNSTSGGAFIVLANWILDKDGFIYGCAWDSNIQAHHIEINSKSDLYKLQGSKYVQSNTTNIFPKVKKRLDDGEYVLFSGTPCQCDALKSFLNKEYEKLYCVELVCHGVPNQKMFSDYIELFEKQNKSKVLDFHFRDKKLGWGALINIEHQNSKGKTKHTYLKPEECYYYYYFFYKGLFFRESCYNCKYANKNRQSDFTIGDFWGAKGMYPKFLNCDGVSLLIVSTQKGLNVLNELREYMLIEESSFESASIENGQLIKPSSKNENYYSLLEEYNRIGAEQFSKQYLNTHKKTVLIGKIKRILPSGLKEKLKIFIK